MEAEVRWAGKSAVDVWLVLTGHGFKPGDRVEVRKISETASADFAAEATALPWAPPTEATKEGKVKDENGEAIYATAVEALRGTFDSRGYAPGSNEQHSANLAYWTANR